MTEEEKQGFRYQVLNEFLDAIYEIYEKNDSFHYHDVVTAYDKLIKKN